MLTLWPPRGTADRKYQPMKKLHEGKCAKGFLLSIRRSNRFARNRPFISSARVAAISICCFFCWNLSASRESSFFFLIFGSILWRKGNAYASLKRLREENKKRRILGRVSRIKNEFRLFRPSFILCKFARARSVTNNCLPRFSIV